MSREKPREKTFCHYCGQQIQGTEGEDFYRIPSKRFGKERFACAHCASQHSYETERNEMRADTKDTKDGIQFAVEWEGHYRDFNPPVINGVSLEGRNIVNAFMASEFNLLPTSDSTVNVEYKEARSHNLHGYKERIKGISEVIDLTNYHSGQHINISKMSWDGDTGRTIRHYAPSLFAPLANYMRAHSEETESVFGRDFNEWADYTTTTFIHDYWLNIRCDSYSESCLEFRLAKFHDYCQFFYLLNFCKDVVILVDKFLHSIEGIYDSELKQKSANKTGEKIVKLFKKYADGDALCMRPERNNRSEARQ